jgi:hypothetical protein
MIPSIAELRKRLIPAAASDSGSNSSSNLSSEYNPPVSTTPTHSVPLPSSKFLVLRQNLPQFGPRSRIVCRLCRRRPDCSVVLRPKRPKMGRGEIERSSLEGWLKHDFVFFGESYLCEECAVAGGFI